MAPMDTVKWSLLRAAVRRSDVRLQGTRGADMRGLCAGLVPMRVMAALMAAEETAAAKWTPSFWYCPASGDAMLLITRCACAETYPAVVTARCIELPAVYAGALEA